MSSYDDKKIVVQHLKFGTTTSDGDLDYNMYVEKEWKFNPSSDTSRLLLEADILGENEFDGFAGRIVAALMTNDCRKRSVQLYSKVTDGVDGILIGYREWAFLRFMRSGSWPALFKSEDLDYSNLLTFRDKTKAFALWDNLRWYSPKEETEGWNFEEIKRKMKYRQ